MFALVTRPTRLLPRGALDAVLQVGIFLLAYESYRLTRGAIDGPHTTSVALANAHRIIHVERSLHLGIEHSVQSFSERVWGLRDVSAFLYINVQTTVTFTAMAYVYVRHTPAFDFVRDVFIGTWALAIVGFLLVPTAPPRLVAGSGLHDTVAIFTGIDPTTPRVSKFFNPYAALPSLHVGVATIVGVSLALLSRRRAVRIAWGLYPLLVTFIVVATGNHYLVDAGAGALAVGIAAAGAWQLGRLRPDAWSFVTPTGQPVASSSRVALGPRIEPGQRPGQRERGHTDGRARDVVDGVVPAEIER